MQQHLPGTNKNVVLQFKNAWHGHFFSHDPILTTYRNVIFSLSARAQAYPNPVTDDRAQVGCVGLTIIMHAGV